MGKGQDVHGELHAAAGAGAIADAFLVCFHGRFADSEHLGDLLVTEIAEHQFDDAGLTCGQAESVDDVVPVGVIEGQGRGRGQDAGGDIVVRMARGRTSKIRASHQSRSGNPRQGV